MKKLFVFLWMFLLVFSVALGAHATMITLQPGPEGKDTWIWDTQDYSHGSESELRVNDTSSYNQYSLIEFDLSSIVGPVTVTSATLELYRYDGSSTSGLVIDAHQVTSPWAETVTWSTRPTWSATVEDSANITTNGWYSWNLTSLTQDWLDGIVDNYGVALFDHGTSYFQRSASSDAPTGPSDGDPPPGPSFRPKFTIDYQSVPEPATMLLLGSGLFWD